MKEFSMPKILVIDDNAAIHEDFRKILNRDDRPAELERLEATLFNETTPVGKQPVFSLDFAFQGKEGLVKVEQAVRLAEPYAMAFVDIRMPPGWDGVETAARLLAVDPELHVVLCTAYSDYTWDQIAERLGRTDRILILKKPFDPIEAKQIATSLTQRWQSNRRVKHTMQNVEKVANERTQALEEAQKNTSRLSIELKAQKERLSYMATHDLLTGLLNRTSFLEQLAIEIDRKRRHPAYKFSVMLIGIDRFKPINDSLGHQAGDVLLVEIAARVNQQIRSSDIIARVGGDEFALLLKDSGQETDTTAFSERIHRILKEPFIVHNVEVLVSASIGITFGSVDHESAEQLLRDTGIAMYRAKSRGKSRSEVLQRDEQDAIMRRLRVEKELSRAVHKSEFVLHYQPIVSLADGKIVGTEALIRWKHPELGLLFPGDFIEVAEQSHHIVAIGEWVMHKACEEMRPLCGPNGLDYVTVNLSARQLAKSGLMETILGVLEQTRMDNKHFKIEVTETMMMGSLPDVYTNLKSLRAADIAICLDDFGTGYSSLSVLHRMPVNVIKIDRTFTKDIEVSRSSAVLVESIVKVAHTLDMQVVAEGIENLAQAKAVYNLGCAYGQGYYYSKPIPIEALKEFLSQRVPPKPARSIVPTAN